MFRKLISYQKFRPATYGCLIFACYFCFFESLSASAEKVVSETSRRDEGVINDPKFHKQLLEIAATYPAYSKVDDLSRWATGLCMFPAPPKARLSQSKDEQTHGKKLYYLYAKHRNSYVKNETDVADQAVVKEAWLQPSEKDIKAADEAKKSRGTPENPIPLFEPDVLGPKSGLYIMYNTGSKTPDTDEGWIYGTVTADGKTVTSAGRVQSCMGCHVSAPHGRLFGLQKQL